MKQFAILFVCVIAACGGGDGDGVDEFVGLWNYEPGSTSKIDCDDNQLDRTSTETGTFMVAQGSDSDLVVDSLDPNAPCPPMKLDVSDGVATAQPGQTCTQVTANATIDLTDQTMRATLDEFGEMTISGTARMTVSGAINTRCTLTITANAAQ